jgi:hypothetical protein
MTRVNALVASAPAGAAATALRRFQALFVVDRGQNRAVGAAQQRHERAERAQGMAPLAKEDHFGEQQGGHHDQRHRHVAHAEGPQ